MPCRNGTLELEPPERGTRILVLFVAGNLVEAARIARVPIGLNHELIARVGEAATIAAIENQPEPTAGGAFVNEIDR